MQDEKAAPRILVFGTGSLGTVYTWLFSRAIPESNITAICRSNYDAASQNGFTVNSTIWGQGLTVRPRIVRSVTEAVGQLPPQAAFDYILVTCKALPTTPSTASLIQPAITSGKTAVVLVQNGIGIEDEYARLYANKGLDVALLSTAVYLPATQTSPAVVEHAVVEHLHVGTYPAHGVPEAHKRAAEKFVDLVRAAGATATLHDDVQAQRWAKLLINASWNPICALTRLTDRDFLATGSGGEGEGGGVTNDAFAFVRDVIREVASIAQACGYTEIDEELVEFQVTRVIKRGPPGITPSMMADALDMRTMETDAIVGNAVRIAKEKDVPVPLLRTIYMLIRGLSTSFANAR
ncbi:2-dehydropantoate 2-reductase [Nemania sp. FL0916]|nr:2-dehydropantoate 2-reductase [Nemania sp. FL0916]